MPKAKTTTVFFCNSCGYESSKWMGQCPACKEWNTFVEETVVKSAKSSSQSITRSVSRPQTITSIEVGDDERISTHLGELDRVLGGGIVPGSLVLVGGDPGIGKSTLIEAIAVSAGFNPEGGTVNFNSGISMRYR